MLRKLLIDDLVVLCATFECQLADLLRGADPAHIRLLGLG